MSPTNRNEPKPATTEATSKRCSESVAGEGRWGGYHSHFCKHPAKVNRNGEWFCTQHDPVRKREILEEKLRQSDEQLQKAREASERTKRILNSHNAAVALAEAVIEVTLLLKNKPTLNTHDMRTVYHMARAFLEASKGEK